MKNVQSKKRGVGICLITVIGLLVITFLTQKDRDLLNNEMFKKMYQCSSRSSGYDNNEKDIELDDTIIDMNAIRNVHPVCFSDKLFTKNETDPLKLLRMSVMKYVLMGENVTTAERYNHLCPFMKNRYNCAVKDKLEYGKNAADWKLVLEQFNGTDTMRCNLWNLIQDMKGPTGIGQEILKQRFGLEEHHDVPVLEKQQAVELWEKGSRDNSRTKINVALFGNSYLRQVFESMMCSWSSDLTYHVMEKDGKYDISIAGLEMRKMRNQTSVLMEELGEMEPLPLDVCRAQCKVSNVS